MEGEHRNPACGSCFSLNLTFSQENATWYVCIASNRMFRAIILNMAIFFFKELLGTSDLSELATLQACPKEIGHYIDKQ